MTGIASGLKELEIVLTAKKELNTVLQPQGTNSVKNQFKLGNRAFKSETSLSDTLILA